jgi:beta-galactosidase GanA
MLYKLQLTSRAHRSLGFNAISAYFFWGIHEPKRGEISFEGFRDLQPFFDAAMKAGLYVIARPGFVLLNLTTSVD